MEALILAGGLGTRLRPVVSDRAKSVAEVAGRPFLAHTLEHLATLPELKRVVLCVGHRADTIEAAFGARFGRLALAYSREERPLGTGGALRLALRRRNARGPVLALNGDTHFPVSLAHLAGFHRVEKAAATLAVARVADTGRYGAVEIRGTRVMAFREKGTKGAGWINGGFYVLGGEALRALRDFPAEAFSLERDFLPGLVAAGTLAAFRSRARFLDIGVPEDYARARALLA